MITLESEFLNFFYSVRAEHTKIIKQYLLIFSSNNLVDEQISIAMETRDHLTSQRIIFKRFQTRINDLSNRFPLINSLIQRIHIRKRRDSIILGLVFVTCTVLLLLYAFH